MVKRSLKVKPDAGYQVQAVYQMPDEQTPLKLVKDSYYEMQVEKEYYCQVVYRKIPASEEKVTARMTERRKNRHQPERSSDSDK